MASHVFVYGTLKTGEPNHYWFEDQSHGFAEIVGPAETAEKFPLVIATKYNLPMLLGMLLQSTTFLMICLDQAGTGRNIKGELYRIDEEKLAHLGLVTENKLYSKCII